MKVIITVILVLIIIFIGLIIISKSEFNDNFKQFIGILLIICSPILGAIIYRNVSENEKVPQAIDVYRGETTLKIIYQDSIPVDSVVIFKEK